MSRAERRRREREAVREARPAPRPRRVGTYWNGERCEARRVTVRVGKSAIPTWWCAKLEGTERPAVEVIYNREVFFLDDEGGLGWQKVTGQRGSPSYPHRSLPSNSVVLEHADGR